MPNQDKFENIFDVAKTSQIMDYKHSSFMAALAAIKINNIQELEGKLEYAAMNDTETQKGTVK